MNCVDEIVRKIANYGNFSENAIRIILNDYDISPKSTELVLNDNKRQKVIQMFIVTKKVEGCTENTINYYVGTLRRFFNEINYRLEEITTDQIRYYLAIRSARDRLSKTSQDNELRVLKSFFKWCSGEEYIQKNPTENIKAVKKEKRIKRPFSETELELIREKAENKRDRAIVEVLYSTGVRVSELCRMNISDIANDEIAVLGKGEKERMVYLNTRAKIAISEYLKTRTDSEDALFIGMNTKKRLSKGRIEKVVRELGEKAGVPNCHPHRFRRTAGTIALNRGMPLEQVQQMLGHEDIATTTIYARSEERNVKASHGKYVV
ncbi:MAG: tyrosine-type recombinase/integrase [Ruminococcus sp.]|nr:tyrosine-type recombinase/integrase [Ruminococcus sp.]